MLGFKLFKRFSKPTTDASNIRQLSDDSWSALGKGYVYPDENLAPAINQAVTLISGAISALRPMLMHVDSAGKRRLVDEGHPVWQLLKRPCGWLSWSSWVNEIIRDTLLHGNSYVVIKNNELLPVQYSGVRCNTGSSQLVYYVTYNFPNKNETETVPADRMLHFKGNALDNFRACGIAPLDRTPSIRELADAMSNAVVTGYRQGVYPSLMVQIQDANLDEEDTDRLCRSLQDRFRNSFGKPLVVGQKVDVKDVKPTSNRQAQMVESRSYLVSEIARIFNIQSEVLLNKLDNATLANVKEYRQMFHTFTLKPHISRFEQTFTNGLLENDIHLVLDQKEFVEGDVLERRKSVIELVAAGIIDRNEAREMLDLSADNEQDLEDERPDSMGTTVT